ncbi:leucine-rich repeat and immunoglobulin-like domain-containing nogo receptor-interacting protein 1-B [Liolophura sinensis]|uniref:leucine-rich repeat and immunoglobulin-like domain-containing nogo receptor-interacting protein 1-B n=1 Tax=Liolophura sinensis TaxID=3198878 RepID=UPI00315843E9
MLSGVVLLLFLSTETINGQCQMEGKVINCKGRHLKDVPSFDILSDRTSVYLNYNDIEYIPPNAFVNISDTPELHVYLDHNVINEIDTNAFAGLENVTVRLFLRENNFTHGLPEAMSSLKRLTHLSFNGIAILSPVVLTNVSSSLEHLSIGLDSLSSWPKQLQHLSHLNSLQVSDMHYGSIPKDAFSGFISSLEFLEITSSNLNSSLDAICPLVNLQTLTLTFGHVKDIDSLFPICPQRLNSTWMLKLQHVTFTLFPDVFHIFPKLTFLEVSHNDKLRFISDEVVSADNKVTELILRKNNLRQIPFVVQNMASLEMLDLSSNQILVVETNDLGNLTRLKRLILSSNPIVDISVHAFSLLPSLQYLGLSHTNLTHLPRAILSQPNITTVDVRSNPIVCGCAMNWILNTNLMSSLIGKCLDKTASKESKVVEYVKTKCKGP